VQRFGDDWRTKDSVALLFDDPLAMVGRLDKIQPSGADTPAAAATSQKPLRSNHSASAAPAQHHDSKSKSKSTKHVMAQSPSQWPGLLTADWKKSTGLYLVHNPFAMPTKPRKGSKPKGRQPTATDIPGQWLIAYTELQALVHGKQQRQSAWELPKGELAGAATQDEKVNALFQQVRAQVDVIPCAHAS
jgi:hypothetical protein